MSNRLCAYVRVVAIAVEMLAVWRLIPERLMLPRAVLATSFPIYLMHRVLIRVLECEAVTQTFPAFMRSTFWGYALQCSGTVVVCVGVALLWKRCFPRAAALFFGGRG